ncbi:DUF2795 domain-containing protein [Nonomuraea sp. NPDC049714]|jgi:hypothetical protein|uniref:DUF2795 domain-containing protein n=1 Tax=Nonomuraea sp. NPDC049714 TaxID=3364357 RepID=UPI0037BD263B
MDEHQKQETEGMVRGGGATHAEEWKEPEPTPASGEDESVRTYAPGHEPGTPEGITQEGVDVRSDLAKWLSDADFPATSLELLQHAERMDAPDHVMDLVSSLPERRYANMAEVGQALGLGVEKRRW